MGADGTGPDDELHARLEAERASTDHWRDLALRRSEALAELRHRPSVRAILAGDRATRSARRRLHGVATRGRETARRWWVAGAALPSRGRLATRRRHLDEALAARAPLTAGPAPDLARIVLDTPTGPRSPADVRTEADTARAGGARLLAFELTTTEALGGDALGRLGAAIGEGALAAAPVVVHPARSPAVASPHDLLVRSAGLAIRLDGDVPEAVALGAGDQPDLTGGPRTVDAALATCLVVDGAAYERAGGWPAVADPDAAAVALCAGLRESGGDLVVVPGAAVHDHRPVPSLAALRHPLAVDGPAWAAAVDAAGAALHRLADPRPPDTLRLVLTVGAPSAKVAQRWGDWHLAEALAASLRRVGHAVLVQTADRANGLAGRACDVHVVLRGLQSVARSDGQRHVLWVISHPEAVTAEECDEADLVLVASPAFAAHLRSQTSTPVEVLPQATDHRRFRPVPPDPAHRHDVVVVAKTREVQRPMVTAAIAAGLRPAIYGSGWDGQVDPALVVTEHVDNEQLPTIYAGAGVVLNDHWETMRTWGFVSNRLFDVLACGVPVISDPIDGLDELFGDAVPVASTPEELAALVTADLADPAAARARAERGRQRVLAAHTFDHRAAVLLARLLALGEERGQDGAGHHGAC